MITVDSILKKYKPIKEELISILHEIQDSNQQNYIPESDIRRVADYLHLTMSEIYGVITYYSMFSVKPRGKYLIRLCNSPVCNTVGSSSIANKIKELLNINYNETTTDGIFTLEKCECLGLCGNKPSLMINKEVFTGLNESVIEEIIKEYKK